MYVRKPWTWLFCTTWQQQIILHSHESSDGSRHCWELCFDLPPTTIGRGQVPTERMASCCFSVCFGNGFWMKLICALQDRRIYERSVSETFLFWNIPYNSGVERSFSRELFCRVAVPACKRFERTASEPAMTKLRTTRACVANSDSYLARFEWRLTKTHESRKNWVVSE